jgi:hypothetical protein
MRQSALILAAAAALTVGPARAGEEQRPLFPFVLPWDDATPGATDLSGWLPAPAGKDGPVRAGTDGHLYTGDRRVRFFGVNLCFDANFPPKEDAEKVAARLAKFGVNVVRFHHMDMFAAPAGIRARGAATTAELDPESLDRLDNLIAQLKRRGIYANLNLLVSRPFSRGDGLPAEIETVDWKDRHVVGFFHEPARKTQQDYARNLLTHRNPHTGLTYADDPAVAFVEINNENGLIHAWLGRQVDRLPEVFRRDLRRQWNDWLRRRHGTTAKLRQAWGVRDERPGPELLVNADFARGTERWVLEHHGQAQAAVEASGDVPAALNSARLRQRSARIAVTQPGAEGWHVQLNQPGLKVQSGRPYTLSFWAKASVPRRITANLGQAHAPWGNLGLGAEVPLTADWQHFRFVVQPTAADDNARAGFSDLARSTGTVWVAGVSFRPGGAVGLEAGERVEDGTVPTFTRDRFGERPAEAQRDWLRFLWETEDAYWRAMHQYVKDELRVRGVVVGTIVGCSTPNLMAPFGAIDAHAYWQHPHFPGRPWDPDNWTVANKTMVNEAGGTLPGLALRRVLGKPHCVTEYNHSAPNTYGSEGFLLLAAYGALQDWDAIYAFAYCHRRDWDTRKITGFFDIDQHPTKMATLPAAVALFVRGDVRPGREQVVAPLTKEREVDLLRSGRAWELVHAGSVGVPREDALLHRVAVATRTVAGVSDPGYSRPTGPRYESDTGELVWDLSTKGRGVVTVNTATSKAVIGYGGGKRFDLGGVVIEPGATAQDGWSTVTVTAKDGPIGAGPTRLLVMATGTAENTDMKWTSTTHDSVGRNWGRAPSLVEGVPARLTLPAPAGRVKAWALDERGQRRDELPVQDGGNDRAAVALGPQWRTLWYEVEVK